MHGEEVTSCASHKKEVLEVVDEDRIEKMIHDVKVKSFAQSRVYDSVWSVAETPLYPRCTKYIYKLVRYFAFDKLKGNL